MDSFFKTVLITLVTVMGLCACAHDPVPSVIMPEIQIVECTGVTDSSAVLRAVVAGAPQKGECGFRYGLSMELLTDSSQEIATIVDEDGNMTADLGGLDPSTVYYYQAFVKQGMMTLNSDLKSFRTLDPEVVVLLPPSEPVTLEAVDLGLSIKWSNLNLGAQRPECDGDLFAWGEHAPKDVYDWTNYAYTDDHGFLTGYNIDADHGAVDYRVYLELSDDAALYAINSHWRTPTYAEWKEIREGCDWKWTDDYSGTGVPGFIVSGRGEFSGNSIFLPDAEGSDGLPIGHYWSSELDIDHPEDAYCFSFANDSTAARMLGYPIRPVTGEPALVQATSIELECLAQTAYLSKSELGKAYRFSRVSIQPDNVRCDRIVWGFTDSGVLEKDVDGEIRIKDYGVCEITATLLDGGLTASYPLTVSEPLPDLSVDKSGSDEDYGFEYVDLGLSVKWAGFNLGADKFYRHGDYYSWADINVFTASSIDDWNDYRFYDAATGKLTKYNVREEDGPVDNLITIEACDDAATFLLGPDWHTPTREEWQELNENCSWLLVKNLGEDGTEGYIVTSKIPGYEDKSMFLPFASYWTASIDSFFDSHFAYKFFKPADLPDKDPTSGGEWRCRSSQIRPVRK